MKQQTDLGTGIALSDSLAVLVIIEDVGCTANMLEPPSGQNTELVATRDRA